MVCSGLVFGFVVKIHLFKESTTKKKIIKIKRAQVGGAEEEQVNPKQTPH